MRHPPPPLATASKWSSDPRSCCEPSPATGAGLDLERGRAESACALPSAAAAAEVLQPAGGSAPARRRG